jgi:hypothetical protein
MILLLVFFTYTLLITYTYGFASKKLIEHFFRTELKNQWLVILLGLVCITTIASLFSSFIRISWEFQLALLIGSIVINIVWKPYRNFRFPLLKQLSVSAWVLVLMIVISTVIILNATSLTPANPDTSIYHAQTIHWIEEYPAVPGLANLHARLGYNSSWLLVNALFSFSFLGLGSFHFMTGFLFLVASLYFASGINNIHAGIIKISDILKTFFLVAIFIFLIDQASSPGTDAPATLFVWIIFTEIVCMIEERTILISQNMNYIFILSIFALTIKLSVFPLVLINLPIIIKTKQPRKILGIIAVFLLMLIPYLIRNLILTGYLVFPGPELDLFKFDWRVPISWLGNEVKVIHWFAALPRIDQSEFYSMAAKQWIPIWFFNQLPRHQAVLISILLMPLVYIILAPLKKWRDYLRDNNYFAFPLIIAYVGVIYWFLSAPAIRFGYGFLLASVSLSFSILIGFFYSRIRQFRVVGSYAVVPLLLAGVIIFSRSTFKFADFQSRILLPNNYPTWSSQPCKFGNFTILCQAGYDACWYDPFPCAISGNDNVEMRGTDFRQGFRNLEN